MKELNKALLPLVAIVFMLSSCAETNLPSITDSSTDVNRAGEFVWRDLVSVNPEASAKFYSDVFGWQISEVENASPTYFTIRNRGKMIGGILEFPEKSKVDGNEWLSTMSAKNVAEIAAMVPVKGGQVFTEPSMVEGRGEYLVVVDPSGGIVALLDSKSGDPQAEKPGTNDWLWTELWSNDPASVVTFYESMGYSFEEESDDDRPYWIMKQGDKRISGMMQSPVENARSMWLPYIRVDDVDAMSARVVRMGGRVISEPQDDVRDGTLALCLDPFGGFFALQEWSN